MSVIELSSREVDNIAIASEGFDVITNQTKNPGEGYVYFAIIVDTDATFGASSVVGDDLPSDLRLAGRVIMGSFNSISVSDNGRILAYKKPR